MGVCIAIDVMTNSNPQNDPVVHLQVLFNSISNEEGWVGWEGIVKARTASGLSKECEVITSNKEDGCLIILESLQKDGYNVSEEDLKVNLDENGKPVDYRCGEDASSLGITVFVVDKTFY